MQDPDAVRTVEAALPEAELEATWSGNARTLLGLASSRTS
jgi:hypothetical protein